MNNSREALTLEKIGARIRLGIPGIGQKRVEQIMTVVERYLGVGK